MSGSLQCLFILNKDTVIFGIMALIMLLIYIEAAFIVLQIIILYSITQYEQQKVTGLDNHSLLSNTFYGIMDHMHALL